MGGKDSFHRKRLRWRLQTFAMAVANVCRDGCKRLQEKRQCTATAPAVHCIRPRSALHSPRKYVRLR